MGISVEAIPTRRAKIGYRLAAMKYLHEKADLTQQRIGDLLGLRCGSAVSQYLRDLTRQVSQDARWKKMRQIAEKLKS
jgi:predicted transcriptional regulator